MYFSPDNERISKSFADKLGLETDFNTCITLQERTGKGKYASYVLG